jgi:hypothetical protein
VCTFVLNRPTTETHLADVEDGQGVPTSHQQLGVILVQRPLVVSNSRSILDDDQVIRVFPLLLALLGRSVQQVVGGDHVIDDGRLGDLLGTELPLGREVLAIVVPEMVVRGDAQGLDTGVDEEFGDDRFELGLTGCGEQASDFSRRQFPHGPPLLTIPRSRLTLEIITSDKALMPLGQLDTSGYKRVGRRTVDVRMSVQDGRNGKDGRGRDLFVRVLNGVCETAQKGGRFISVDRIGDLPSSRLVTHSTSYRRYR